MQSKQRSLRKRFPVKAAAAVCVGLLMAMPLMANAQSRAHQRNTWRDLALGSAVIGAIGLFGNDGTVTLLGLGGAAYCFYRYNQEREMGFALTRQGPISFGLTSFGPKGYEHGRDACGYVQYSVRF